MEYTNKQGLPESLYQAIANDPYKKGGAFSGSELPGPPQIRVLKQRHPITVDVADMIYPLIGNNVHYILERMGIKNSLQEEQFISTVDGVKVSGRPDFYDSGYVLWDYKVTTRFVLIDGVKPEWEAQTNIYAWLLENHQFKVEDIRICTIFRDWSKIQAMKNPDYPKCQVAVLPVTFWKACDTEDYIRQRLDLHLGAEELDDNELPECTAKERWDKPTIYAVMKKGRKSSVRNLPTLEDSERYLHDKQLDQNHSIQVRPGESTRCEYYCDVKQFCQQYKRMNNA
jgi:hypothetical protein